MRFFVRPRVAAFALTTCAAVAAGAAPQQHWASDFQDYSYETTGSVGVTAGRELPLSDEQRERIYRGLRPFPDSARGEMPAPDVADRLPRDTRLEDLPANVVEEAPLLRGHKFVKLDD